QDPEYGQRNEFFHGCSSTSKGLQTYLFSNNILFDANGQEMSTAVFQGCVFEDEPRLVQGVQRSRQKARTLMDEDFLYAGLHYVPVSIDCLQQ
ncbi:MAG: hypothetical protein ACPL7J_11320, partial [Desulfomonilaceae bacterium]